MVKKRDIIKNRAAEMISTGGIIIFITLITISKNIK